MNISFKKRLRYYECIWSMDDDKCRVEWKRVGGGGPEKEKGGSAGWQSRCPVGAVQDLWT
jgi:hypothetical protein